MTTDRQPAGPAGARAPAPAWRTHLLLIGGLAVLTAAFSLPVLRNPFVMTFPDYTRDNYFYFWALWWDKLAILTGRDLFHTDLLYYPYGTTLAFTETIPLPAVMSLPILAASKSPGVLVFTLNLWTMLSFVFLGWATFLFARWLTGSTRGALFAGLMLPFSAFRFHHLEHVSLLATGWLPLTLWAAGHWCLRPAGAAAGPAADLPPRRPSVGWLVGLGLCGFGLATVSYTLLAFTSFLLAGWLGITALADRRRLLPGAAWRLGAAAVVFAAGTLPMTRYWLGAFGAGDAPHATLQETLRWGPDLLGFLLPTRSLLLGGMARALGVRTHGPGGDEVYLGFVFLLLAVIGARAAGRRGLPLTLTGLAAFALAIGPVLWVGGRAIHLPFTPYGAFLKLLPALTAARTPERYLMPMAAALGPIIAIGFDRITRGPRRGWVMFLVGALAAVELFPALAPAQRAVVPPVHERLRDDPAPGAVLELSGRADGIMLALFHQTVHGRPVVGDCLSRPSPGARSLARDLDVYHRLSREAGVDGALADLNQAGVAFLVLNRDGMSPPAWRATFDALARHAELFEVGETEAVFRLGSRQVTGRR